MASVVADIMSAEQIVALEQMISAKRRQEVSILGNDW
jgi:hypothetical protein